MGAFRYTSPSARLFKGRGISWGKKIFQYAQVGTLRPAEIFSVGAAQTFSAPQYVFTGGKIRLVYHVRKMVLAISARISNKP